MVQLNVVVAVGERVVRSVMVMMAGVATGQGRGDVVLVRVMVVVIVVDVVVVVVIVVVVVVRLHVMVLLIVKLVAHQWLCVRLEASGRLNDNQLVVLINVDRRGSWREARC